MRYMIPLVILGGFASLFIGWAYAYSRERRDDRNDRHQDADQ